MTPTGVIPLDMSSSMRKGYLYVNIDGFTNLNDAVHFISTLDDRDLVRVEAQGEIPVTNNSGEAGEQEWRSLSDSYISVEEFPGEIDFIRSEDIRIFSSIDNYAVRIRRTL